MLYWYIIHFHILVGVLGLSTFTLTWMDGFLSFTLSFLFPQRLHWCYIDLHCSYLYSYYNCSPTLCIKC